MPSSPVFDPVENTFTDSYGLTLHAVHHPDQCCSHITGRPCVIHNPTDHHMREWPIMWRYDRRIFERICPHGVGHPDPDDMYYHCEILGHDYEAVHGCDGCCMTEEQREEFGLNPDEA